MKSQSAPEASADTKAKYLENGTQKKMTCFDSTFREHVRRCVERHKYFWHHFFLTENMEIPVHLNISVTVWDPPAVSAHHLQNKSPLVAEKRQQQLN